MCYKDDLWVVQKIFNLSDQALIRMVNHLFRTEYGDGEDVRKEWNEHGVICIWLTIGCANRYEFQIRRMDGLLQIYAEDRGCVFHYVDAAEHSVVQIREPQIIYFGGNAKEEFFTTLEFPGNERITLPIHTITLADYSVRQLEESGLILFLPFLFYCFAAQSEESEAKQESLKYFVIHDIVGILHASMKKGDLTAFDTQSLKQLCRRMVWKLLIREKWMQNLELQELILDALEADLEFLERVCRIEFQKAQNK
ncbi:MAG: hypothetical protein KH452_06465 [Clostridiales bacterium]|nr:hypothetical protein [Clostridiales bacterium]